MDEDKQILELALREMSLALDALAAECTDADGNPKAPSRQVLMRSRGMLPPYCEQALAKKPSNAGSNWPSGVAAKVRVD
ncbi:MAG: hypothetical protein CVU31_11640 [Betaproteobacteria bacterium HGW-Betaproteobacteria-4]|jgi:hypothetical protein|nr:MAG: hypothetical protein CVU31_11640 [Betaproteobacteria bacterium HGW-Betaproteobacteria-4]